MERLGHWFLEIPPATRCWTLAIFCFSMATTTKLVKYQSIIFIPDKVFGTQYWRFITSFCYFGDITLEWFLNFWLLIRFSRLFEDSYSTLFALFPLIIDTFNPTQIEDLRKVIDKNKTYDFLYFIGLVCSSIVGLVSYVHYKIGIHFHVLGPFLEDITLYIWCRNNPEVMINFLGIINVSSVYLPVLNALLSFVLSKEFYEAVLFISTGNFSLIKTILSHSLFIRILICFTLGHIWWFTRDFLLRHIYYDSHNDRRTSKNRLFQEYKVSRYNITKAILVLLLLPPWYWFTLNRIRQLA